MSGRSQLPSGLVTFMFTDIEGSTRLARLLGADYPAVLRQHRAVLRKTLTGGGIELFTEGDSFFVVFADATVAVQAAVDAQRALATHDWPGPQATPRVRMGLHTGRVQPSAGEYASAEVHRAARIAAAAHGGQVLCSAATARHARRPPDAALVDLGLHRLRGFDDCERIFQLVAPDLTHDFPRPRTPPAARHNLPADVSSFVGRRTEMDAVTDLLTGRRLITITGAGGSGKTRLALAVAGRLVDAYPDGVWFVDLADVPKPAGVTSAVAAALGLRAEPGRAVLDTVAEYAAARRMLLLLDTCDAHPAAAADVALRLLADAARLTVLATGREPLAVPGELVWLLPPLPVDAGPGGTPEAVQLLAERVVTARGGRPVPATELADLHQVASRLDGLPLAIELAAARLRILPAGQLVERLADPLAALDPDPTHPSGCWPANRRHRSLAASVHWSYRTLGASAARLLRGLAVFAEPVDLAAVEWVGGPAAVGSLCVLVDKSLVEVVAGPAATHYRMSAATRGYARGLLAASGAEAAARERHVAWSLHALHGVRVDTDGQPRTLSLNAVAPFVPEWRAALSWSAAAGSVRHGVRLAVGLDPWWREHGESADARQWLAQLWARLDETGEPVPEADLAAACLLHAAHAADLDERVEFLRRAEAAARRADDPCLLIRALAGRRVPLLEADRFVEAERVCRDVIRRAEQFGVPEAALAAVIGLGELLWRRGALDEAAELLGAARQVEAGHPEDRGRRTVDMLLGLVALRRGDLIAGHDHLVVALRSRIRYGFRRGAAETVNAIATRCALGGDPVTAAMLFGAGEAARGAGRAGAFGDFWAQQQATLRATVGDAVFDPAYAAGARLDLDQAVTVALSVEHPDLEVGSVRFAEFAGPRY